MSLARLYTVKKSRKEWTCGKCGDKIAKGESVIHFSVGFRGYEQHRCSKPSCYPKPSERESSMISQVYAAQEDADFTGNTIEDLESALESIAVLSLQEVDLGVFQVRSLEGALAIEPVSSNVIDISVHGTSAEFSTTEKVDEFGRTWKVV